MLAVQYIVGVQNEAVPQGASLPTVQGVSGGGVIREAMQAPPQGVGVVHTMVGVQYDAVPQGPLLPTVQGICGGTYSEAMQAPLQDVVGLHVASLAQVLPTIHRESPEAKALDAEANITDERVSNPRDRMFTSSIDDGARYQSEQRWGDLGSILCLYTPRLSEDLEEFPLGIEHP